ncbi:diflavin oxidoreductase [Myroides sp. C4067]|uniref:diflavin oxidoreductase n=1 Tax=Myroides sp. C4067 TaxID=3136765 RepID=UPI003100D68F
MQFDQKITSLQKQVENYSREELIWFNGYLSGLLAQNEIQPSNPIAVNQSLKVSVKPLILYGSETGNSKKVALELLKLCKQNKLQAKSLDLATYKVEDLSKEDFIILICSTQGEGEPPLSAQKFFDSLSKVKLELSNVRYCLLALGDSSYPLFCKAGEDLDKLLLQQGAQSTLPIKKLDVDYKKHTATWFKTVLDTIEKSRGSIVEEGNHKDINVQITVEKLNVKKEYQGVVSHSVLLNDRESNKQTYHLEIRSDITIDYQPGDAIGVYPPNKLGTMISIAKLLGEESRYEELEGLSITGLTKGVINKLSTYLGVDIIEAKIDLLDLLETYSNRKPIELDGIKAILQPIAPRLYSISSSNLAHEDEVHLTVALDQFLVGEEKKQGLCSSYFSELEVGQELSFYIHRNSEFYLPDSDKDIIMIGPGTGIAPFRGFIEHRDTSGAEGRNWLFFGEQHFICDFYYQTEIQQWLESGVLTNLDTAFSRDQKHKIYVQDRLRERASEVWDWIESGAIIYVCGQKSPMSEDVERVLVEIIMEEKNTSFKAAEEYLEEMFLSGQYKKDVY